LRPARNGSSKLSLVRGSVGELNACPLVSPVDETMFTR
jgi:hypothetical protein